MCVKATAPKFTRLTSGGPTEEARAPKTLVFTTLTVRECTTHFTHMDEWLEEFKNWLTEEEEAQAYAEIFLGTHFSQLPRDIQRTISAKFWRAQYAKALQFVWINAPNAWKKYHGHHYCKHSACMIHLARLKVVSRKEAWNPCACVFLLKYFISFVRSFMQIRRGLS